MNAFARLLFLPLLFTGCTSAPYVRAQEVHIQRFDKDFFHFIEAEDSSAAADMAAAYPVMLDILGKGVLNLPSIAAPDFFDKLTAYYADSTLRTLYRQSIERFDDVTDIERQLATPLAFLSDTLGKLPVPQLYMHVSGFSQNVLAGEGVLSLSIDKYLGVHPLYDEYFYDYQQRLMQPEYIVRDYLAGWLMSEFPFTGGDNVLLERMIYEGKIRYLTRKALPDSSIAHILGYSPDEYRHFLDNEALIWHTLLDRKHLYTPDYPTTQRYFDPRPATFLADGLPGNLGVCIGLHIVARYV
ncbi:MAG: gliding motility protein GldB, partial [Tannerellaceae bacterium]|nr:gliding motility protein GldB [Tannerellaceae bacterium]